MSKLSRDAHKYLQLNKNELIEIAKCYVFEIKKWGMNTSDITRQCISNKWIHFIYDGETMAGGYRFSEINNNNPEDSNESDYTFNFADNI